MAKQTLKQLQALAASSEDQTQASKGVEFAPPKAGIGVGVFTDYIELGMQKQRPYKGKPKPDANMVYMGFDLTAPRHIRTWTKDDEEFSAPERITFKLTKKLDERAKYWKVLQAMRYGRDSIKHMASMLTEHFKVQVTHSVVKGKDGAADRTYANLWSEAGIGIGAPKHQPDPLVDEFVDMPKGNSTSPVRIFLWANPTQETWDSLYIDGTREDGKSKNWLQEMILGATNFEGSPLHLMLGDVADLPMGEAQDEGATDTPELEAPEVSDEEVVEDVPFEEEVAPEPVKPAAKKVVVPKTTAKVPEKAEKPQAASKPDTAEKKVATAKAPTKTAPKAATAPALSPSQQALKDMGLLN